MKREVTLLVTSTGGTLAPSAFLELRRSPLLNYRLVGINSSQPVAAQKVLDAFYLVPPGGSPEYVPALMNVIRRENVEVVLPCSDEEAFLVSSMKRDLQSMGVKALVSPPECLDLISDKHRTYVSLSKRGIRVPEFTAVTDREGLLNAIDRYGFPDRSVVVKPCRGRGGRGLQVLCGRDNPALWLGRGKRENRVEIDAASREGLAMLFQEESLVMPCLREPAYDADVVFLEEGQYSVILRRRMNPSGIPFEGNRIVADPEVLSYCKHVAECLGLQALHDIDLMTDSEGNVVVLEVNPRPSGSLAASLAAGFPIIDWAVSVVLDLRVDVFEIKKDIEVRPAPCVFAIAV